MVVGSIDETKILVQYETLKTDDEMQPLVEMADASNVRPLPPTIHRMDRFKMHEEVDAWYNDGWWVGHVSKILGGLINEKWVASFLVSLAFNIVFFNID